MRQDLRWALGGTLLLSAAALWWPQSSPKVVGAIDAVAGNAAQTQEGSQTALPLQGPLPSALDTWQLEPARRDPFAPVLAPAPAVAVALPPQPVAAQTPVVERPAVPPLTLRYLGRMVTPDGRPMVLLARGDVAVFVESGMTLDEGYRVLRITAEAVRLVYPPTGAEVDIPIPPVPNSP